MFNITSNFFRIFNNKPPASRVAHITKDLLTCYSRLYYGLIILLIFEAFIQTAMPSGS